jgi:hypothetical protein
MKIRVWTIALLLNAWFGIAHAEEWQVVLLKPRGCVYCGYLEEALKRSAQLRQATLDDGAGNRVTAAIQRRDSADLSAQEWRELRALPYFDERRWRAQAGEGAAMVLLKRDGVIASAGDVAESADLRTARFPGDLTMPDIGTDLFAVREARSKFITDLYLGSWNLSWFYRLALNPEVRRTRSTAAWINASAGTLTPPLGPVNVLLMSTASGAADNEIFNALRIEEIRGALTPALIAPDQLRIFYGGGNAPGANALELRDGRVGLIRRDVEGASPNTPDAVQRIFQSIRAQPGSRNLLVLIGHGNPDGAGMWGSPVPLAPSALRVLHEHGGGDDVLVSGNCFGGVMARATSCGFFGARPDIVATGCQADAAAVAQSRDYLHTFFSALAPGARRLVDADGDGAVSFVEAHWYASLEGDIRNVTYTSVDALADAYFDAHPDELPRNMAVRDMLALTEGAPAPEARTLRTLLTGYDGALMLPMDDLAAQVGARNPSSAAPRVLVAQLARRLLFLKSAAGKGEDVARLQSCENRPVAAFLKP